MSAPLDQVWAIQVKTVAQSLFPPLDDICIFKISKREFSVIQWPR